MSKIFSLAQKQSAIKRINERYAEIRRAVNKDQLPRSVLERYEDAIRAAAGNFLLKSGNISHGKKAAESIDDEAIQNLLSRETAGEAKKKIREQVVKEYGEGFTQDDLEEYFSDMDFVNRELSEKPSETYDALDNAFRGVPGLKTYSQLAEAIRVYNYPPDGVREVNPFDATSYYFK